MKYEELNEKEIEEHEKLLIQKADNFWIEMYGRAEGSDIDKIRLLSRQGKLNDQFQHDIMTHYFKKHGLWTDGKTTLKEREKQLILQKQEFGKKIASLRDSKIKDIDIIIKEAEDKKKSLAKIPVKLMEEFKINKAEILSKLQGELDNLYMNSKDWIEKETTKIYTEFINTTKNKQDSLINQARQDLEGIQTHQKIRLESEVKNFASELEAELTVLDYIEKDKANIDQYNKEITTINQELNELIKIPEIIEPPQPEPKPEIPVSKPPEKPMEMNLDLEALTMKDLRDIADSNGIEYDTKIRKAELIELLK